MLTNFLGKTGVARAINDRGQIIGRSRNHPYIWDELRGEQDLNNLLDESSQGWKIWEATDINNQGAIVGWGINPSGVGAAFLATPVEVLLADLTDNGAVDFEDLTVLLSNWNQWGTSRQEGNLVNAGSTPVNFEDLTVLLAEWTGPAAAGAAPAAVPEPSSLLLALFGALALVLRRRGARS